MSARARQQQRAAWLLSILILLAGFALRVYRIEGQPLSGDEAYSVVVWTRSPVSSLLNSVALATTEPHPPLALLSLHAWARLAGDSILAVRMLSALASVVTLAAVYQLGRQLGGTRTALLAALFCALNPFQLWYAQFARNYSLWMAGSAVTVLLLLRAWKKPGRAAGWLAYVLAASLTAYVFYLEAFFLVAHNLYALTRVRRRPEHLRTWVIVQASIAALLAPWYLRPELRVNSRDYEPNAGPANILWAVQSFLLGDTLPPPLQDPLVAQPAHSLGVASAVSVVLVAAALFVIWKAVSRDALYLLLPYGLVPLAMLAGLALITGRGYFHPRYIAASSAPFILIAASGIAGLQRLHSPGPQLRRLVTLGAAGLVVALSGVGLLNYRFSPAFARGPDWMGIMETLNAQAGAGDVVIYNFPDPAFAYYFDSYHTGGARRALMPTSRSAAYLQVAEGMSRLTASADYIWFMPVESEAWDSQQNVARWLAEEKQFISEQWIGGTRLRQYADWQPSAGQAARRLAARFAGVAQLEGYRVTPPLDGWQPTASAHVELFWRPLGPTDSGLKVFMHVIGPARQDGTTLWAQDDHFPQGGRISTQDWPPGDLLRDVYNLTLPPDAPPGQYTVVVGFYDPATGQRIPLENPQQAGGADYATVLTFALP